MMRPRRLAREGTIMPVHEADDLLVAGNPVFAPRARASG